MLNLAKIPTTIVTGFLGSGKTTLLRHVLQSAGDLRLAVLVNEFGELGVDGELLKSCPLECPEEAAAEEGRIFELANGCLCCTVQEEFFPVMQALVDRREEIDHILIETSGLALPKPLVQAFNWPEIRSACTVDAVITVVDGPATAAGQFAASPSAVDAQRRADENLDHESPLHELFEDQLSAADLVVLNKTDLMTAEEIESVTALVRREVPAQVKLLEAVQGRLDRRMLIGHQVASEERIHLRPDHHSRHHGPNGIDDHDHDRFDSVAVRLPELEEPGLTERLEAIVRANTIYRVKGFVAVPGKPMRLVVHGVGRRFDRHYDRRWRPDETRETRIVFIGEGLEAARLQSEVESAFMAVA